MWWAAVPRKHWQQAEGQRPDEQADWHPRFGDRAQQLVFIGQDMDEATLRAGRDFVRRMPATVFAAMVSCTFPLCGQVGYKYAKYVFLFNTRFVLLDPPGGGGGEGVRGDITGVMSSD